MFHIKYGYIDTYLYLFFWLLQLFDIQMYGYKYILTIAIVVVLISL